MPSVSGNPTHNALIHIECTRTIAPERITRALERFLDFCPWPAARLRRSMPWGALSWIAAARAKLVAPPVRRVTIGSPAARHAAIEVELNTPIDAVHEAPVRFLVIDHGDDPATARGTLVMTWFHPLMDPRGAQNLLSHLVAIDRNNGEPAWGTALPDFIAATDTRPLLTRARIAGRCYDLMQSLFSAPVRSPGTSLKLAGGLRFRWETFVEPPQAPASSSPKQEIWWRLALAGKALGGVWRERGWPDDPYVVPISVDLRRIGDREPTFGNMLAFHFARFKPSETADIPAVVRELRNQMMNAVRTDAIDANMAGMELIKYGMSFIKYRGPAKFLHGMSWTQGGETFSFACADLTTFPADLATVFGAPVANACHIAAVPPRPGLGVFFNRTGDNVNLVLVWAEGALEDRHLDQIVTAIQEGMGWQRPV